jgi:UDP-glucose 4-epimerase
MRILITGAFGYLGSWLTHHFLNQGYAVTALTHSGNQTLSHANLDIIHADLRELSELKDALGKNYDYCLHTGSLNDAGEPNYFRKALEVNALGTRNLAQALAGTPLKQFIYFSTFHVYGKRDGVISEDSKIAPCNDYASTHYFGETYVAQIHRSLGLPFTILRITNGYGAPFNLESSKWYLVLNDLARMAFREQKIVLNSNGNAMRDFIWIQDLCQIIERILGAKNCLSEVFNLGSEKTHSILDLARMVQGAYQKRYHKPLQIQTNAEDKSAPNTSLFVDCNKLKTVIDYKLHEAFIDEIHTIFDLLETRKT